MQSLWLDEMAADHYEDDLINLLESSSDEEPTKHGGSRPGRSGNVERGRVSAALRLYHDYFSPTPVYGPEVFARRFRLPRSIFLRIVQALEVHDPYFTQRKDCIGRLGFTSLQKATAAIRLLAYGSAADSIDEYIRIGESTALECLEHFCEGVIACFAETYLRSPTEDDIKRILLRSGKRGFPGMLGSIDCSKWRWKNCPTAYHGQYEGKEGEPALTLEIIADDTLWIWHAFFGMPGCANDINVLEASTLSNKIADCTYPPPVRFEVNGESRKVPYWLADGIYPKWPCFLQTFLEPVTRKEKLLASSQEAMRKDAERAFGVLQAKFHIVQRPSLFWYTSTMKYVMRCCVILHNMMVEYRMEHEAQKDSGEYFTGSVGQDNNPMWSLSVGREDAIPPPGSIGAMCALSRFNADEGEYHKTRQLVMDHLWSRKGSEQ